MSAETKPEKKESPYQPWYEAWLARGGVGTVMEKHFFMEGFHAAAPLANPWHSCGGRESQPSPDLGRVLEGLEYMARNENYQDEGMLHRPGGYRKEGIVAISGEVRPWAFARELVKLLAYELALANLPAPSTQPAPVKGGEGV